MAGDFELLAGSENHFHTGASGIEITFYRNDRGEVDRMVVAEDGETAEAMKVPSISDIEILLDYVYF